MLLLTTPRCTNWFWYLWVPRLKSILNGGTLRFAAATKHANRDPQVTRTGSCMLDMLQIDSPAESILHGRRSTMGMPLRSDHGCHKSFGHKDRLEHSKIQKPAWANTFHFCPAIHFLELFSSGASAEDYEVSLHNGDMKSHHII